MLVIKHNFKICKICQMEVENKISKCNCGYNFSKNEIEGELYIPKDTKWFEKVIIKKRVYDFQVEKFGLKLSTSPSALGWSMRDVAKNLFRESISNFSQDLKLAQALETHPELKSCNTKSKSRKLLKNIEMSMNVFSSSNFESEMEFRDYLRDNWNTTSLGLEWKLEYSEYDTNEVGRIDLLAHHKKESKWLVIELKLTKSSDQTLGQLLRYLGWVKKNLAQESESVIGLIISQMVDRELYYALMNNLDIGLKLYSYEGDKIILKNYDPEKYEAERLFEIIKHLSKDEQEKFIKQIEKN